MDAGELAHGGGWRGLMAYGVVRGLTKLFDSAVWNSVSSVSKNRLANALAALPNVEVFPSEANLVLARFGAGRANRIWKELADRGVLVRNFDRPGPLEGCLRITVGTPEENRMLSLALIDLCAR